MLKTFFNLLNIPYYFLLFVQIGLAFYVHKLDLSAKALSPILILLMGILLLNHVFFFSQKLKKYTQHSLRQLSYLERRKISQNLRDLHIIFIAFIALIESMILLG